MLEPSDAENKAIAEPNDNTKLYTILKVTGIIVCSATILFGIYYGFYYFSSGVDPIADTALKGLEDSAEVADVATREALTALKEKENILEAQKVKLIKEIPKIKPKHYYIPPKR